MNVFRFVKLVDRDASQRHTSKSPYDQKWLHSDEGGQEPLEASFSTMQSSLVPFLCKLQSFGVGAGEPGKGRSRFGTHVSRFTGRK